MSDPITAGESLDQKPIIADAKGLEVYGIKAGQDYRAIVGSAGGIALQDDVDMITRAQIGGAIGFATKSAMDADLAHSAGALALVTNDSTPANNTVYRKAGESGSGSWVAAANMDLIRGKSAYEVAVANGFAGTELEWLTSLEGDVTPEALAAQEAAEDAAIAADASADAAATSASAAADIASAASASLASNDIYATTAAGLAAVSEGGYFSVPSGNDNEYLILYRDVAGVAVEIKRYPSASAALKPAWSGKVNGWPDPFFRRVTLASQTMLGRDRWWGGTVGGAFIGWSLVTNMLFDGMALRRGHATGSVNSGPVIWLDDLGAVAGDTITVYSLWVNGAGNPTVTSPGIFDNGVDVGYVGSAVNPVNASGGSAITASTTPEWLRHTVVVPVGAVRFALYPTVGTDAAKSADMLALWAFKGDATEGPSWPTLDPESSATAIEIAAIQDDLAANYDEHSALRVVADYGFLRTQQATGSAESIALDVTAPALSTQWGGTFSGWAGRYTPAGVSFNAVRAKIIGRGTHTEAQEWRTINVVIRTGANSHAAAAPIVAVGSVLVDPKDEVLNDVTILLTDPVTGTPVTLSDASFSGGEYFIGIYARNAAGVYASMSYHLGTQSNTQSLTYYMSNTGTPTTAAWTAVAGGNNKQVGVQHLLLTSPVVSEIVTPTPALRTGLQVLPSPILALPPKFYVLQGREVSLYKDNVVVPAASRFDWGYSGTTNVKKQNERYMFNHTAAIAAADVTLTLYDPDSNTVVATAVTNLVGAASSAGSGLNKKCLFITDSLGANYMSALTAIAGSDVMGITLLGTLGTAPNKHESRAGWTMLNYTQGVSVAGNANAFWIGGAINFPQYLIDNSIATPDWVFVQLGTNDMLSISTDDTLTALAASTFAAFDAFITSIKAADPNIKIAMVPPPAPTSDEDGFSTSAVPRWRYKRNVILWNRAFHAYYGGREAERIYVCPSWLNLDTKNNFPVDASAPVNSRATVNATRQNNNVHPAPSGYSQHADAVWAFLKCNAGA